MRRHRRKDGYSSIYFCGEGNSTELETSELLAFVLLVDGRLDAARLVFWLTAPGKRDADSQMGNRNVVLGADQPSEKKHNVFPLSEPPAIPLDEQSSKCHCGPHVARHGLRTQTAGDVATDFHRLQTRLSRWPACAFPS